jgi:hypothetical protein
MLPPLAPLQVKLGQSWVKVEHLKVPTWRGVLRVSVGIRMRMRGSLMCVMRAVHPIECT